jgi:hypothetical protein
MQEVIAYSNELSTTLRLSKDLELNKRDSVEVFT